MCLHFKVEIFFFLQDSGTLVEFIQDTYLNAWFALKISNLPFPSQAPFKALVLFKG